MEKPYVLGIDMGGTGTKFGIVDARGNVHIVLPDGRVYNIVGASVK